MAPKKRSKKSSAKASPSSTPRRAGRNSDRTDLEELPPIKLRIIGGRFRGRPVQYRGDRATRPMRDSVRENLFNILGKSGVTGVIAWDLFSGTGVLGMEAVSRGASRAVCIEWNRPAAKTIEASAAELGMDDRVEVLMGDAFRLGPEKMEEETDDTPWLVFFSPPYAFWTEQEATMCGLVRWVARRAPLGSVLVTESDRNWDPERLPGEGWDVRTYGHTQLAFFEPQLLCGMDPDNLPD